MRLKLLKNKMEIINTLSWDMNPCDSSTAPWYNHIEIIYTDEKTGYPMRRFLKTIEWCKIVHPSGPWALDWGFMDEKNSIADAYKGVIKFDADANVRDVMSSIASLIHPMGNFEALIYSAERSKEEGIPTFVLHWVF